MNALRLGILLRLWFVLLSLVMILIDEFAGASLWGQWAYFILWWAVFPLWLVSCFLITAQEPRTTLLEQGWTLRRAIRWFAVIFMVQSITASWTQFVIPPSVFDFAHNAFGFLWLAVFTCELVLLRQLALRAPNMRLARSTWNCFRLSLPSGLIFVGCIITGELFSTLAPKFYTAVTIIGGLSVFVLLIICVPWFMWIYVRYYRIFRDEMRIARSYESAPLPE